MERIYQTIKQQEPKTLFIITKSQNKNVLQYSIQDDHKTIQPLWWMYEKEGVPKERINFIEDSLAYGVHHLDNHLDNNHFYLSGYPKIILEAKHRQNLNVHQTLAKAKEKAGGDVILAWKKTKRKGNSKVRVADGERIVYIIDEDLLFKLLESYTGEDNAS